MLAFPDVTQVTRHPAETKTFQGNPGNHYQERNFVVATERTGTHYIEFELTRNDHMKDPDAPFTVTAMFKGPPVTYVEEAWRILRGACYDNCLRSAIVDRNHEEALKKLQDLWESEFGESKEAPRSSQDTGLAMSDSQPAAAVVEPAVKRARNGRYHAGHRAHFLGRARYH